MPEGHSVHRIARQFARNFVGHSVAASSPQGRFTAGAAQISGHELLEAFAVGKQMFLEFSNGLWVRIHLGIYGAWDFAGDIAVDATIASANGRMGQTNAHGTVFDADGENSLASIGAPRKARVKMGEQTRSVDLTGRADFPPEPVGQVRLRLVAHGVCADLRGPTACEVLTQEQVDAVVAKLGPDPQHDASKQAEKKFIERLRTKTTPVGIQLMDQSVVAGIGNVYRAEMLFRARIDPYRPANLVTDEEARALWKDWVKLLAIGIETGQMMTIDGLRGKKWELAMANRADRHWVYKREGLPCRVCGTNIALAEMATRKLYWCPTCQR
jgi:formamidopyrimidine-DNA glycosylase